MNQIDAIRRLKAADPVRREHLPPEGLFATITATEPGGGPVAPPAPAARRRRAALRALAVLLASLAVGVGAAWAATGKNPIRTVFGQEISISESDFALDSFSILEPMTEEDLAKLPRSIGFTVSSLRSLAEIRSRAGARAGGGPPAGPGVDYGAVSAIGQTEMPDGSVATMMVLGDQVCGQWRGGAGNCAPLELIDERGMFGAYPEPGGRGLAKVAGIVTDEVEAIAVEGSDDPPTPVSNMYLFRHMPPVATRLIGLDEHGAEVMRIGVPLDAYADMDD